MQPDIITCEYSRLQEVAQEYRQLGYQVVIEPRANDLPDFLATIPIDLLAIGAEETIVVEVRTQETLVDAPRLDSIAKAIDGRPGWRYDLVVHPRNSTLLKIGNTRLLIRDEIAHRLAESRQLSGEEHGEAAFLMVWSALESILRGIATREAIAVDRLTSLQLIKSLFVYGLLDKQEYELLREGYEVRNQITHGFKEKESVASLFPRLLALAEKSNQYK